MKPAPFNFPVSELAEVLSTLIRDGYLVPTQPQLKGMLDWWTRLDHQEQVVFAASKLDPVHYWETFRSRCFLGCLDNDSFVFDLVQSARNDFKYGFETTLVGAVTQSVTNAVLSPMMQFEFELVDVVGGMGAYSWGKRKNWGELISVGPITSEFDVSGRRVAAQHKPNSPFFQKYRGREWLKSKLGSRFRPLVNLARKNSLVAFKAQLFGGPVEHRMSDDGTEDRSIRPVKHDRVRTIKRNGISKTYYYRTVFEKPNLKFAGAETEIRERLGMSVEEFWRHCKGNEIISEERMADPQRLLFGVQS